jgi:hypothetical protein
VFRSVRRATGDHLKGGHAAGNPAGLEDPRRERHQPADLAVDPPCWKPAADAAEPDARFLGGERFDDFATRVLPAFSDSLRIRLAYAPDRCHGG